LDNRNNQIYNLKEIKVLKKIILITCFVIFLAIFSIGFYNSSFMSFVLPNELRIEYILGIKTYLIGLISGLICGIISTTAGSTKTFKNKIINKILLIWGILMIIMMIIFILFYIFGIST